ncbi:sensor histidine kinase, partial [Streptomyces scabiei]|nr:sensor histidine kinase [Streptomyces scabiei]
MSGFTGLGENIRAAGLLAPSDTCLRPLPGRPLSPVEQPIRPHRAGRRTVGFWLIATLATLGAVAALSAHTLAQQLTARTDQEIARAGALGGFGGPVAAAGAVPGTRPGAREAPAPGPEVTTASLPPSAAVTASAPVPAPSPPRTAGARPWSCLLYQS